MKIHLEDNTTLGIVGCRTFQDFEFFSEVLAPIKDKIQTVVSGGAKGKLPETDKGLLNYVNNLKSNQGADTLAAIWARLNRKEFIEHLPQWKKYGRAAGPIRNKSIVESSDTIIAFWDGKSSGTKSTISIAKSQGVPIHIIEI